ncbi:hypothetical protein K431DRAFT_296476 [Polychaeton citri CBS 116435]|uniref:Uncharacterized protein n=1 Tax=Polychaeton citri CBS 116435 TaxID=1314669 RepID=A0A9P4UND0_9PEZI|nr:hypothetical protein K431DRAFT_296476 [Polychaeton citri CBS 116435]
MATLDRKLEPTSKQQIKEEHDSPDDVGTSNSNTLGSSPGPSGALESIERNPPSNMSVPVIFLTTSLPGDAIETIRTLFANDCFWPTTFDFSQGTNWPSATYTSPYLGQRVEHLSYMLRDAQSAPSFVNRRVFAVIDETDVAQGTISVCKRGSGIYDGETLQCWRVQAVRASETMSFLRP